MSDDIQFLDLSDHSTLPLAYSTCAGKISRVGALLAQTRQAHQMAEHERKRTEASCYLQARARMEEIAQATGKDGAKKAPTEAQVDAFMRTDPVLSSMYDAAVLAEYTAEASYEAMRANYKAVCTEADLAAEVARDRRAEMGHIDPTLRAVPGRMQGNPSVPSVSFSFEPPAPAPVVVPPMLEGSRETALFGDDRPGMVKGCALARVEPLASCTACNGGPCQSEKYKVEPLSAKKPTRRGPA